MTDPIQVSVSTSLCDSQCSYIHSGVLPDYFLKGITVYPVFSDTVITSHRESLLYRCFFYHSTSPYPAVLLLCCSKK